MAQLLLLLGSSMSIIVCTAQSIKHKPLPRARALNDSAINVYQRAKGDAGVLLQVTGLLDAAIKADSIYYEAWNNKLSLLGQHDKFDNEYQCLKTMRRLFPKEEEVQFNLGVLACKTAKEKEALSVFSQLLAHYDDLLEKNKNNTNTKGLLYNKGIVLVLMNRTAEGKAILNKLYTDEKNPYVKSSIGFYINSSKQEIINDRIPGK